MRPVHRTVPPLAILGVLLLGAASSLPAQGFVLGNDRDPWSFVPAFSGGGATEEAIAQVRAAGEAGQEVLEPLLASYRAYCATGDCGRDSTARDALDRMCGVRDCTDLRLFWYTDLDAALATARREGKAALSLRLMGRLDEELSCANSRFFRTVFYRDPAIARVLREKYVLHWRSVAPVPKVTIVFADGRRIERTVVGNSLHYVLDGHGRPILALPGLMGPKNFRRALETVAPYAAGHSTALDDEAQLRWAHEAWRIRQDRRRTLLERAMQDVKTGGTGAYLQTGSKAVVISRVEPALDMDYVPPDDPVLRELAEARRSVIQLSPQSRELLLAKHGETDSGRAARLIASFEASIALDEVIDLYRMEPAILEHLLAADEPIDLEELTDWIYREVFDTPLDDPFLGLAPDHVYAALPAATAPDRGRDRP